jgi:perosamine synthetase
MIGDQVVGSFGDIATFSFFGNKILTTGEGGMVTTPSDELAGYVRLFRGQGQDPARRYWFPIIGYNYRMTNIAAALGLAQLERLDDHVADRRRVGDGYDRRLSGLHESLQLPIERSGYTNVRWLYTVVLKERVRLARDEVIASLASAGVESRPVFYPMHDLPPYRDAVGSFPEADRLSARGISLPTHGYLSDDDLDYICDCLERILS